MHESTKVCCHRQRLESTSMRDLTQASNIKSASCKRINQNSEKKFRNFKIKKHPGHEAKELLMLVADENNNNELGGVEKQINAGRHDHLKFKYQFNARRSDIEQMRELLRNERRMQLQSNEFSAEELDFYAADYERMMIDDWLVTRFLLRGKKAYERNSSKTTAALRATATATATAKTTAKTTTTTTTTGGNFEYLQNQRNAGVYEHTLELIKVCAKFRFEYRISDKTTLNEFPPEWTNVEGLIHYRHDLVGNPTAYLRVVLHRPKLIELPEARRQFKRYLLYLLELCDRELHNRPGKAICCVFDMTNAGFENIDLELTTWMIKSFENCSPKLLCYVIVYNPPWFFTATFKIICNTLLSTSKRQSVKFACGNEILDYISHDNLPPYLKAAIH